jgi:hypothetical protein
MKNIPCLSNSPATCPHPSLIRIDLVPTVTISKTAQGPSSITFFSKWSREEQKKAMALQAAD